MTKEEAEKLNEKYRVIENGAEPDNDSGIILNTTYSVTYYDANNSTHTDSGTNEFIATETSRTHNIEVICTNEYVENKLTIKKVDELDGSLLEDAEFTTYNTSNQLKYIYKTDENGLTEIMYDSLRYDKNTLYYAVETKAPSRHILPDEPQKIYFYFNINAIKKSRVFSQNFLNHKIK